MKKNIRLTLLILAFASSVLAQTVNVNLSSTKQVIKGFGAINHPVWYGDLNTQERELAFGNGPGQMGLNVLRIWVSDNPNQWSLELATAKKAIEHGAIVFATPWNPPASMTYIDNLGEKRISTNSFAAYAKHLNDFVLYMRSNGVDLYAISTQNEPDYAEKWTKWTPQESVDFIKAYADKIDCRIMTPESFQYRKDVYDPILNDATALSKVDIFGTHLYGTVVEDFPYPLFKQKGAGKELWMTEVYTDSKQDANLWPLALDVSEHIHNAMVEGEFQTYVWWPMRRYYAFIHDAEGGHGNANVAKAGTVTKRGFAMAQFSKFIRPGFVRVDATKTPSAKVFASAYKKGDDVVVVLVNKNTSTKTINISVPNTKVKTWERYVTSATKNVNKESDINGSTTFSVTLDAESATTLVGVAAANDPVITLDGPVDSASFVGPATVTLSATATDPDGTIQKVVFYSGDSVIVQKYIYPYIWDWTNVPPGNYQIKAVATDDKGNTTTSKTVSIKVNVAQGPYGGIPVELPGKVEFENYDVGGNGFAYFDDSPKSEVVSDFRTDEDVDVEVSQDVGGGHTLVYTTAGEWTEYTVKVTESGNYNISLRVACNVDGRTLSLATGEQVIAADVKIPNTGGWQVWQNVEITNVYLEAGTQVLRATIGELDYVNLNYMTFALDAIVDQKNIIKSEADFAKVMLKNIAKNEYQINYAGEFSYQLSLVDGSVVQKGQAVQTVQLGQGLEQGLYLLTVEDSYGNISNFNLLLQ